MATYDQENRFITVDTPLGKDKLLIRNFFGSEAISEPFRFHLDLVSQDDALSFEGIVGKATTITFTLADGSPKYFNGVISSFTQGSSSGNTDAETRDLTLYQAVMVPWFWLLTLTSDSRIFQKKSVPDIVKAIFDENGFKDYKVDLNETYDPREYCVQYNETDFNFISRLLEEEGICYFFTHEKEKHIMVLADAAENHKACPKQEEVKYQTSGGGWLEEDVITNLVTTKSLRVSKFAVSDYNFTIPTTDLTSEASSNIPIGQGVREMFYYPAKYDSKTRGDKVANLLMQAEEARITTINGTSDCRSFVSGYKFKLKNYYRSSLSDKEYVLTSIEHNASQPIEQGDDASKVAYFNNFTIIPYEVPYRPVRVTPKPVISGTQTAIVVGPAGDEIHTDEHGRVMVQFHWDRVGKMDDNSSCWIRVAQLYAGAKWGAMFLPRIGQEVIIDFLEGDPDRPIIVGTVYHGLNKTPYELPAHKTKTSIKSYSSKGGGGFNEIRFEDDKGNEELYLHAQKDMNIEVENDRKETINQDRHLTVLRDKLDNIDRDNHLIINRDLVFQIGRDQHIALKGKSAIKITESQSIEVDGDVIEKFNSDHSHVVSSNYYLQGKKLVVEGLSQLCLKVGGNFITIDSSGITMVGSMVKINSGGSALSGSAKSVVSPTAPIVASKTEPLAPGEESKLPQVKGAAVNMTYEDFKAHNSPTHKEPEDEDEKKKTAWIEVKLVNEDGDPVPGEKYRITLPDGSTVAEGTLDAEGKAKVTGIDPPGNCKVTFPNLDKDAWEKK